MKKQILLMLAITASTLTFSQNWSQDFEGSAPTFISRPAPAPTAEVVTNPVTTGINTSTNAVKITLTDGTPPWKWMGIDNPGGTYNDANGKFIKFKFLSVNETAVTIQLEPWFDGTKYDGMPVKTFTGLTLNTWYEVEFDYSTLSVATAGYCGRLDIKLNFTPGVNNDGDVFYIDDMSQQTASTLSNKSFELNKVGVYPNPANNQITINTEEKFKSVKVYDVIGKKVKAFKNTKVLDISKLNKGIYFLKTDTGLSAKFVKN